MENFSSHCFLEELASCYRLPEICLLLVLMLAARRRKHDSVAVDMELPSVKKVWQHMIHDDVWPKEKLVKLCSRKQQYPKMGWGKEIEMDKTS